MKLFVRMFMLVLLAATGHALAQGAASYPSKPVRIIVPFPSGGPSDVQARVIGQKLSDSWKQPVIVDNRPGANTIIGADAVAKAAPDGYTLLLVIDSTLVMNQSLYTKLPYDPIKDFAPVTLTAWSPLILVVDAATGPSSVKDLIAQAKANPGKLNFGAGTITTQLGGEMLKSAAGIDMVFVPYKGSPGTVQGLLSGDVKIIIDGVTSSVPHIKSGKFRVLANMGSRPIAALPGIPTVAAETGLTSVDIAVWQGLVAPAGTPPDIIAKLRQDVVRVLNLAEVREKFLSVGLDPATSTSAEFAAFIKTEAERWSKIIKQANIHLD